MLSAPNSVTFGLWGPVIMAVLWIVLFVSFTLGSNDEAKGLTASSIIMVPISSIMFLLNMFTVYYVGIPTVLSVIGLMVLTVNKGKD